MGRGLLMRMKGGILGAGGGGGASSALSGMDQVLIAGGFGAAPLVAPFSNDIAPTSINVLAPTWVDPTISGTQVTITQSGIYLVNATVSTPDDLAGKTGIVQAWPDWGSNTSVQAFGSTLIDLANGGSGTVTFLFNVAHDRQGSFGIGMTIPAGIATLHWTWNGQVARLGGFA